MVDVDPRSMNMIAGAVSLNRENAAKDLEGNADDGAQLYQGSFVFGIGHESHREAYHQVEWLHWDPDQRFDHRIEETEVLWTLHAARTHVSESLKRRSLYRSTSAQVRIIKGFRLMDAKTMHSSTRSMSWLTNVECVV
jgi:hypothetical protein